MKKKFLRIIEWSKSFYSRNRWINLILSFSVAVYMVCIVDVPRQMKKKFLRIIEWSQSFYSRNRWVNLILGFSVAVYMVCIVDVPRQWIAARFEPVFGLGLLSKGSESLMMLCRAYISSWIFWLIVNYLKGEREQKNVRLFIAPKIRVILEFYSEMVRMITNEQVSFEEPRRTFPSREVIEVGFNQASSDQELTRLLSNLGTLANSIVAHNNLIYKVMPYLDTNLLRIQQEIEDNFFVKMAQAWNAQKLHLPLAVICPSLVKSFLQYQEAIVELSKYYDEFLRPLNDKHPWNSKDNEEGNFG